MILHIRVDDYYAKFGRRCDLIDSWRRWNEISGVLGGMLLKTLWGQLFFAASGAVMLVACGHNSKHQTVYLTVDDAGDSILVRVGNGANESIKLMNLNEFSLSSQEPGLVFVIKDENNHDKKICAMIDPSRGADEVVVSTIGSKEHIDLRWQKDVLARRYCLLPGRYRLQVNLNQGDKIYASNEIYFKSLSKP